MMKTLIFSLCLLLTTGAHQVMAQKPVKIVINVPNAQTENCKIRIENYLKQEYGIVSSLVNYKSHKVTIRYIPGRTNPENIKTAIANLGFDADDIKANPESYKMLPPDCRYPEEKKDSSQTSQQ